MVRRQTIAVVMMTVTALMLVACRDTPTPPANAGRADVRLETPSGSTNAQTYGVPASERGVVVLADQGGTDAWSAVASELGRAGYQVIVLPGRAQDGPSAARAAAEHLTRQGVKQIVFIGSGQGVAPALEAARGGASGVGVLNPQHESAIVPADGLPPVALLVMASLRDGRSAAAAQQIYGAAREPRTLALYPAADAAPAAFAGESNELKAAFIDFLRTAFQPLTA